MKSVLTLSPEQVQYGWQSNVIKIQWGAMQIHHHANRDLTHTYSAPDNLRNTTLSLVEHTSRFPEPINYKQWGAKKAY